jgi:hypothetical protein
MKIEREKKSRQAEVTSSIMVKLEMAKNTCKNVKKNPCFYQFLQIKIKQFYDHIMQELLKTGKLISKSLAELAAEDTKLGGALLSKEHTLYLSFLGPINPSLSSPKFRSCL